MIIKNKIKNKKIKSQIEVDQNVVNFLGDQKIITTDDLVSLKNKILHSLEFRPYNEKTKKHEHSMRWKRTASEIINDGYVYSGKACSDLAVVYLALCKAVGINGRLVKLVSMDKYNTHSIVEVKLKDRWYRIDPSSRDSIPFLGALNSKSIWNKKYKVWKKGRDVWDLGLDGIDAGDKFLNKLK